VASFVQDVDRSRVLTAASIMEEPRVMVRPGDGPRAAMRALRTDQASAAFVVEPGRRLVGTVTEERVTEALRDSEGVVRDLMETELVTTHADTPLAELLTPASQTKLPLAVVDGDGRLAGVIPRVTLLAALGEQPRTVVDPNHDSDGGDDANAGDADTDGPIKEAAGA
jgi:glycine betaine/proline transport system ATP-binding protein